MIDRADKAVDHGAMDCPRDAMIARLDAFQVQAEARLEVIRSSLDQQHAASASALREGSGRTRKRVIAIAACVMLLSMAILAAAVALALD